MLDAILAPTDFSTGSESATTYAAKMANQFGATLWLLHVGTRVADQDERAAGAAIDIYHRAREEQARVATLKMERLVSSLRQDHPGLEVGAEFTDGAAHAAILRVAERLGVDMIVMGTAGLTGLSHFLIGSTAERVVRVSQVPVLTVRGTSG